MKGFFKNMMDNKKTLDNIKICDKKERQERIDFLLAHPEEVTDGEMELVTRLKGILDKFQEVQQALPFRQYVWEQLQKLKSFDAKIIFLKEVIALWKVNAVNAEIINGDNTAKGVKDEHIKLYSAWLTYFQEMKVLEEETGKINAQFKINESGGVANAVLSQNMLDRVYEECNGTLWQRINKEDFKGMLVSGSIGFQIKNGNRQRVMALLNRISFTISDEKAKSAWVANVERSLDVKRLSKIYELDEMNSEPNKKFNRFLNGIYSK